jgi:DNA-binding NarL/FixJ family response regulator
LIEANTIMGEEPDLILAQWADSGEPSSEGARFMRDSDQLPESLQQVTIVLDQGTEARASELIALGAERVLLADAALLDSTAVVRLVQQHGAERVGVWLPVKKRQIYWAIDYISNEDFNCLTPSFGKAGWEVVKSDGTSTGTDAEWWVSEMLSLGASMALISVDAQDDDLNICAGLMENHGEKLWFSPWQLPDADLEPWVRYGRVRRLVLPAPNARDEEEMTRICAAALTEHESTAG